MLQIPFPQGPFRKTDPDTLFKNRCVEEVSPFHNQPQTRHSPHHHKPDCLKCGPEAFIGSFSVALMAAIEEKKGKSEL